MSAAPAVVLDDADHTYRVGDRRVPSVTGVLRQIDDLEGIPREYLERAAHFGRHVHMACHLFDEGVLDLEALDPPLKPYLDGWILFRETTDSVVLHSELPVYHEALGVAGTLDKVLAWRLTADPAVLDIKSSSVVPRSVRPQTAAYRELYLRSHPGKRLSRNRYCCHLKGDGTYALHRYSSATDYNVFVSALNCHRWMEEK